jgi:hypothetical protein
MDPPDVGARFLRHLPGASSMDERRLALWSVQIWKMNLTRLSPVGQPAHHTWYSKEHREKVEREALSSINAWHEFSHMIDHLPIARYIKPLYAIRVGLNTILLCEG